MEERFEASRLVDDEGADGTRYVQFADFVRYGGRHLLDGINLFEGSAMVIVSPLKFLVPADVDGGAFRDYGLFVYADTDFERQEPQLAETCTGSSGHGDSTRAWEKRRSDASMVYKKCWEIWQNEKMAHCGSISEVSSCL